MTIVVKEKLSFGDELNSGFFIERFYVEELELHIDVVRDNKFAHAYSPGVVGKLCSVPVEADYEQYEDEEMLFNFAVGGALKDAISELLHSGIIKLDWKEKE